MEKPIVGNSLGAIRIADEVVEVIAGLAASEVEGIASMSGGFVGDLAHVFARGKNLSKGVKVEVGEQEAAVDLFVNVEYGVAIPEVAARAQIAVKEAIESMTGLAVVETNVHVVGVSFREELVVKEEEARSKK